jgi:DNA repair protein SbcD/Mre11
MSGQHFRFLQSGQFVLDQPLTGIAEIPDALAEILVDAPFDSAQRVFDSAIEERVDFVVLTGDLLDLAQPAPRALAFLLEQFERLSAQGITAYWAGGRSDPAADWPQTVTLPKSVHIFPTQQVEELSHFRGSRPVANIIGRSWHGTASVQVGDVSSDDDGLTTVVVGYGQSNAEHLGEQMVDYWALGGQVERETLGTKQRVIHYAGRPQGRSPRDSGPHGCTLVHVAGDRAMRSQFTPTDAVRWQLEKVALEPGETLEGARQKLAESAKQLRAEAGNRPLLVHWKITGGSHLAGPAARQDLAAEWQEWLRKDFFLSGGKPALWTHKVELDHAELPDDWFAEDSMLGEFLRNLRELKGTELSDLYLDVEIPAHHRTPALATLGQWSRDEQLEVLGEVGLTGAQLLGAAEREA